MTYTVTVVATTDDKAQAERMLSALEDIASHYGDLEDGNITTPEYPDWEPGNSDYR